jgi:isoleucyl-tRNA synthetase
VLDILFNALVRYAAPVLVFTAEEVWQSRYPGSDSVHLLEWPEIGRWEDDDLGMEWTALRALRAQVLEAIEPMRREKVVGSGLEAEVAVPASAALSLQPDALAELFITAKVSLADGESVEVSRTDDHKCGRCWRYLPEVTEDGALCARCEDVLNG